ncbi:MAG: hypothetical protein KTR32_30915 [Granulosicoccus sp.]|nr:hypothetical protein [Granulosicoccus sp.]
MWPGTDLSAAIFACEARDGSVVYQDRVCPSSPSPVETKRKTEHPLGIHESWLELPDNISDRASCDKYGCQCGQINRHHQDSLASAVADALYIDGSWQRYEWARKQWEELPLNSRQLSTKRETLRDAACEVMIAQQLLYRFSKQVLNTLRKQVRMAENRGFDTTDACLQGKPQACELYDAVQLYSRLVKDSAALHNARELHKATNE